MFLPFLVTKVLSERLHDVSALPCGGSFVQEVATTVVTFAASVVRPQGPKTETGFEVKLSPVLVSIPPVVRERAR